MLDWKSIKEKAQKISADVSAIADEISASAKDFVADAKVKADETLVEVKSAAKNISDKAIEMWDSEEAVELRAKAKGTAAHLKEWTGTNAANLAQHAKDVVSETSQKATEIWNSEEVVLAREKAKEAAFHAKEWTDENASLVAKYAKEIAAETGQKASEMWNSEGVTKFRGSSKKAVRVVTGMQAVEDRRKSIKTREEADLLKAEIEETNEALRDDLNDILETFGKYRLEALSATVGKFLHCLELMNQRAKGKEYEFLSEIDIMTEEIKEMESVDMKASDALRTLAVGGGFAAVGIIGTPAIVTGAVTAFCAASTGTAISTLSGAAASNAVLAWLGGGTLAAGGGGVAAGTAVLGVMTAGATIGLAVVAVGTLASRFYAKKNTEAEAYLADVKVWAEQMQASWTVLAGVKSRIIELHNLTCRLCEKAEVHMKELEALAPNFDTNNEDHIKLFQQCAIMAKSMSELAQTPILDADGNISEQSGIIASKTETILNTEL